MKNLGKKLVFGGLLAGFMEARANEFDEYKSLGVEIQNMVAKKTIDAGELKTKVNKMVDIAIKQAKAYQAKHPNGAKVLEEVISNMDMIKGLPGAEVEKKWHDLEHFTKEVVAKVGINPKDEDHEHFSDPIHMMVHPIIALKSGEAFAAGKKEDDLKVVKAEIAEALEQADNVKAALAKK